MEQPHVLENALNIKRQAQPPFGEMFANRFGDLLQFNVGLGLVVAADGSRRTFSNLLRLAPTAVGGYVLPWRKQT